MSLLSVNEDIEVFEDPDRYDAELQPIDQGREVQLTIFSKNLKCLFAAYKHIVRLTWIQDPRSLIFL